MVKKEPKAWGVFVQKKTFGAEYPRERAIKIYKNRENAYKFKRRNPDYAVRPLYDLDTPTKKSKLKSPTRKQVKKPVSVQTRVRTKNLSKRKSRLYK